MYTEQEGGDLIFKKTGTARTWTRRLWRRARAMYTSESGTFFMHCHHNFSKTDTACTQSKMGVASYFEGKQAQYGHGHDGYGGVHGRCNIFHVDTVIIFLHVTNTRMISRGERKLDCLKRESKVATSEAPTFAVPMHAPQMTSL